MRKNISILTIVFMLLFVVNFALADFGELRERYNRYEGPERAEMIHKDQEEIQKRLFEITKEKQRAVREIKSSTPHDIDKEDILKMKRHMEEEIKRQGASRTERGMREHIKESAREFERDINERLKKTMPAKRYEEKYDRAKELRKEAKEIMKKEIHERKRAEHAPAVMKKVPARAVPLFAPTVLPYVPTSSKEAIEEQRKITKEFIEKIKNAKTEEERQKAIEEFKEKNRKLVEKRKEEAIKHLKEHKEEAGKLARSYLASVIIKTQSIIGKFQFTIKRLNEIASFLDAKGKDTADLRLYLDSTEQYVMSANEMLKTVVDTLKTAQNSEDINEIKNLVEQVRPQIIQIKSELKNAKEQIKKALKLIKELI